MYELVSACIVAVIVFGVVVAALVAVISRPRPATAAAKDRRKADPETERPIDPRSMGGIIGRLLDVVDSGELSADDHDRALSGIALHRQVVSLVCVLEHISRRYHRPEILSTVVVERGPFTIEAALTKATECDEGGCSTFQLWFAVITLGGVDMTDRPGPWWSEIKPWLNQFETTVNALMKQVIEVGACRKRDVETLERRAREAHQREKRRGYRTPLSSGVVVEGANVRTHKRHDCLAALRYAGPPPFYVATG